MGLLDTSRSLRCGFSSGLGCDCGLAPRESEAWGRERDWDEGETGGGMRRTSEVGVDEEGDSRKIGEGKEGGLTLLPWGFSSGGLSCGLLSLSAVAGLESR